MARSRPTSSSKASASASAGAYSNLTLRADSGFYSGAVAAACRKAGVRYSITVKLNKALHEYSGVSVHPVLSFRTPRLASGGGGL